jgi:four helix bundle protein
MSIRSYQDLRVWQEAMSLAERVYQLTRQFPKDELFGLTAQMRRAAVSIPANIAEGYGRESKGAYQQFLRVAQGSVKELETHALIAQRVEILAEADATSLLSMTEVVGKMLRALIRSLDQ